MKKRGKRAQDDAPYSLVYSTDGQIETHCPGCRRPAGSCVCKGKGSWAEAKLAPSIRFERKGRGGKSVTVISKLPPQEALLKDLLTFLKRSLGSGGTSYIEEGVGVVEVQGDQRDRIGDLILRFKP